MTSQSSVLERLNLLSREEVIEILGYSVDDNGKCRQLDRITSPKYCEKNGIRHLPHYFKGKKMRVDKDEFQQWLNQFKY